MLYSASDLESVVPAIGDDVVTPYGRGRVMGKVNVVIKKKKKKKEVVKEEESDTNFEFDGGEQNDDHNGVMETGQETGGRITEAEEMEEHGLSLEENELEPRRTLTKYRVELSLWRLAGRSSVDCYLFPPSVQVVRKKKLEEMNATERVEFARRQKASAVYVFKERHYQQALNLYAGAVDAVRYVQHDASSTNEVRADLVEVMVTCSNNAATCCVQMKKWPEAARFAQNAIVLLDSLYKKRGMKIHSILNKDNEQCDAKIFGEWRIKSLLIIARSCAERKDHDSAVDILKRARGIVDSYCSVDGENADMGAKASDELTKDSLKRLRSQDREVRKLLSASFERRKAEKKKEKARARAMFEEKDMEASNNKQQADNEVIHENKPDKEKKEVFLGMKESNGRGDLSDISSVSRKDEMKEDRDQAAPKILKTQAVPNKPAAFKSGGRRVSFSKDVEEKEIELESQDEEDEPWYEEHREALFLVCAAGLASLSFVAMRAMRR